MNMNSRVFTRAQITSPAALISMRLAIAIAHVAIPFGSHSRVGLPLLVRGWHSTENAEEDLVDVVPFLAGSIDNFLDEVGFRIGQNPVGDASVQESHDLRERNPRGELVLDELLVRLAKHPEEVTGTPGAVSFPKHEP